MLCISLKKSKGSLDRWRLPAILELVGSCQSHVQGLGCSVVSVVEVLIPEVIHVRLMADGLIKCWKDPSNQFKKSFGCKLQGYSQLRICSSQAGGMEQLLVLTGSILCGLVDSVAFDRRDFSHTSSCF